MNKKKRIAFITLSSTNIQMASCKIETFVKKLLYIMRQNTGDWDRTQHNFFQYNLIYDMM